MEELRQKLAEEDKPDQAAKAEAETRARAEKIRNKLDGLRAEEAALRSQIAALRREVGYYNDDDHRSEDAKSGDGEDDQDKEGDGSVVVIVVVVFVVVAPGRVRGRAHGGDGGRRGVPGARQGLWSLGGGQRSEWVTGKQKIARRI